jgi:mono/diheme cytochrome c family protein
MLPGAAMLCVAAAAAAQAPAHHRAPWAPPARVEALRNPLVSNPAAALGGSRVFRERCSQCHGSDGTGTSFGPRLTGRRAQEQSDGVLFWKITSGNTRSGMPTFSYMPEIQRWQLVLHLRALASSHSSTSSSR